MKTITPTSQKDLPYITVKDSLLLEKNKDSMTTEAYLHYHIVDYLKKCTQPTSFGKMCRGVISTNDGNDFKEFLKKINEIGYCCAWKILDSQYVRVDSFPRAIPQRRRRVFVVGYFGDEWQYPAEILFEPQEMLGDSPPKRVKGKGFTNIVE